MTSATAGIVVALSLVYLFVCSRPIWHTDVWGHLSYGRSIWETGSLPATEPLLKSARGTPIVDAPWLSQLIGYAVISIPRLGLAGLQGLLAIGVVLCGGMLSQATYRATRHGWFSLLSLALFLVITWGPLTVLRPQLAGLVCFILILTRLIRRPSQNSDWLVIPFAFCVWANVHPSFLVGLGLIGSMSFGRALDLMTRTGSVQRTLRDQGMRRLLGLLLVASTAVLLNPYGVRLYAEVFRFSAHENLQDLTEWQPLNFREGPGLLFAAIVVMTIVVYRLSPRRVACWEFLSLVGLGFSTVWSSRMIIWWGPLAAILFTRHCFSLWRHNRRLALVPEMRKTCQKWTVLAFCVATVCFTISPLGRAVVFDQHSPTKSSVSRFTPVFAAEYLNRHPPRGPVFNTYEWGDYLLWAGPREMELFVYSHAHLVPRNDWIAYLQVIEVQSGWSETLDQYGFNTIVIDRQNRGKLIERLMLETKWSSNPVEQDGQVIFFRNE